MTYFISDLHFGHRNILRFDCRPFSTIEEHDEYLINQWNDTVGTDDDVWILGDISWYSALKTVNILKRLNGKKHLCIGNHDHKQYIRGSLCPDKTHRCHNRCDCRKGKIETVSQPAAVIQK